MVIAAGLDIGGTKIETQVFDENWVQVDKLRGATPDNYTDLVAEVARQIAWAERKAGGAVPVGIGAAGVVDQRTGRILAANLVASGRLFPADIEEAAGRRVAFLNDCRALAVSEAVFGAGGGHARVLAVILGTGIGGGAALHGRPMQGATGMGGEFGHIAAPAHVVAQYDLPIWACGCGRRGCYETYLAGPGLQRLARHVTGLDRTPEQIADARAAEMAPVWEIWCALAGEFMHTLTLVADPDVIVLGGGLSKIDGLTQDVTRAAQAAQLGDFGVPPIVVAAAGDTSGARGAAYAAWLDAQGSGI